MRSVGKRVVTTALCALLAVSPLVGCASDAKKADSQSASSEEAYKEAEELEFRARRSPTAGRARACERDNPLTGGAPIPHGVGATAI